MAQNLELVEKLVEKTGLSYAESKAALENADWDILEAMINLEAEGKIKVGHTVEYTTKNSANDSLDEKSGKNERSGRKQESEKHEEYKKNTKSVGEWLKCIFDKGNANCIEVYKNGYKKLGMPVTVFILLLVVGFWAIIPLMIVGLFFGFVYRFSGPDLGKDNINDAIGKATNVAENIKNEFKNTTD